MRAEAEKFGKTAATRSLTPRQARFISEYIRTSNGTQSYIDAGYSASKREHAAAEAHKLLRKPNIAQVLQDQMNAVFERTVLDKAQVIDLLIGIMTADIREHSEVWRCACRYCRGIKHKYQWRNLAEFDEERVRHAGLSEKMQAGTRAPDDGGGYGYTKNALPHPHCPMCDGHGEVFAYFHDSRGYSKSAAITYNGVVVTRGGGFKVKNLSKMDASKMLARILGMF